MPTTIVEDIESSESSDSVKKIYQFFDWDGDGKLEMEDIKNISRVKV